MKELQQSDLQPGDILVFENFDFSLEELNKRIPEGFWDKLDSEKWMPAAWYLLLHMIAWFDPGDDPVNYKSFYHAAIWGNVNVNRDKEGEAPAFVNTIVQAGPNGIGQSGLTANLEHETVRKIYVYRHKEYGALMGEKLNQHTRLYYNDTSIPYSFTTAWLLAVICSMRYTSGTLYQMLTEKIGAAMATVMVGIIQKLINDYNEDHKKEMIACSTLVANIYKAAGFALDFSLLNQNHTVIQHACISRASCLV